MALACFMAIQPRSVHVPTASLLHMLPRHAWDQVATNPNPGMLRVEGRRFAHKGVMMYPVQLDTALIVLPGVGSGPARAITTPTHTVVPSLNTPARKKGNAVREERRKSDLFGLVPNRHRHPFVSLPTKNCQSYITDRGRDILWEIT